MCWCEIDPTGKPNEYDSFSSYWTPDRDLGLLKPFKPSIMMCYFADDPLAWYLCAQFTDQPGFITAYSYRHTCLTVDDNFIDPYMEGRLRFSSGSRPATDALDIIPLPTTTVPLESDFKLQGK
jgi:hypothetical protein